MSESIITFIIPTIGRKTLYRTVDSLLNQTNPNWKAIIIFDGINKIEFNDVRIKSIEVSKKGEMGRFHGKSGLVRNEGLRLVETEWVGFVDDDDTLHVNYVDFLYKKYFNYDLVVWRMKLNNGQIIPRPNNNSLVFGNVGISYCYKRLNNETVYFKNNRDGEDYDMVQELLGRSNNYIVTEDCFYFVNY
jgi:glycosyltransferase involved in cell wall biosynthesis